MRHLPVLKDKRVTAEGKESWVPVLPFASRWLLIMAWSEGTLWSSLPPSSHQMAACSALGWQNLGTE